MRLTSDVFQDRGELPARYTCDGVNVSPPLSWTDVPAHTRSFALVVDDPDAPSQCWAHWIIADLPPDTRSLAEGAHPRHQGVNDWNHENWGGPCPPSGRHRYFFKLYALDRVLDLAHPTKQELERAMNGHVIAEATLVATYARTPDA